MPLFFGPLQETIAWFFGPSSLTFSAKSAILELKGVENEIFSLCMMFKKVISFIYETIYFGDRVPLTKLAYLATGWLLVDSSKSILHLLLTVFT